MVNALFLPVAVVYVAVVAVLAVYGTNYFYLTFLAWVRRDQHAAEPRLISYPRVAVQLPIYNEPFVVERVIAAAGRLDYPAERLQIQVLDDSTDETTALATKAVARLRRQGVDAVLIHRKNRQGFKAGALAEGLRRTDAEFIAIFDADFVPPPDFLRRTLPHFHDARLAFVQTRWGHVNRDSSILTLLQSIGLDAHFMVEQFARSSAGFWFNFNGSGGVWRRAALEDAGGWSADTLTEDLDLSYRAFLRGWHARYLRDVEVPAELPASFSAYRQQQHRWAMGSLECAAKLIPRVWGSKASLSRKIEATLHLSGYAVHLLLFALVLLYPIVLMLVPRHPGLISLFGMGALFSVAAFAPTLFLLFAQHELGRRWWLLLPGVVLTTALGAGMMLNTVRAGVQLLLGQRIGFERTPKSGAVGRHSNQADHHHPLPVDGIVVFEFALAALNISTIVFALRTHNWMVASYAGLYCLGLLSTPLWTISQALSARGHAEHTRTPPTTARA